MKDNKISCGPILCVGLLLYFLLDFIFKGFIFVIVLFLLLIFFLSAYFFYNNFEVVRKLKIIDKYYEFVDKSILDENKYIPTESLSSATLDDKIDYLACMCDVIVNEKKKGK